ncbi:MAG: serine hydrolase [Lysobacterales bacterium]
MTACAIRAHHILEQVTGKPYGQVLNEYVFGLAGMANSGVFVGDLGNAEPKPTDIAVGFRNASEGFPGDYPLPAFIGGGSYTQAADIIALQYALDAGKVLTPMTIEIFRTVTTAEKDYAYGGYIVLKSGNRYSWQSGSNGATNVVSVHPIDGNYSFVAASNTGHSQDSMFELASDIEARLFDGRLSD